MANRTSAPCAKEGCGRSVRFDNANFPYCYQHGKISRHRSTFERLATTDMQGIREMLYNPRKTMLKPMRITSEILSASSHLPVREAVAICRAWSIANRGVKYWLPQEAAANRDLVNVDLSKAFRNQGYEVTEVHCEGGLVLIPEKGSMTCGDHEVLMIEKGDETLIVDGSPAAPLNGIVDNVRTEFPSGTSTTADGLYMASPFEYGEFSSVSYSVISTDSEVLWESRKINEDQSVQIQRELALRNPPAVPEITYRVDREDPDDEPEDVSEDVSEPQEMSLEYLLAQKGIELK